MNRIGQSISAIGWTGEVGALEGKAGSIVHMDGKAYLKTEYTVDFGEKNGTARVTVLDPCVTEEAQRKRREAIVRKCEELIRQGLM